MGPVFRAHERVEHGRERLVAVKVFRLEFSPEQAEAFQRELEFLIGRRLAHPAIATPFAAGADNHAPYLAMEYVVGDSLDARVAAPMPLGDAARIVEAIASGIDACADRGVHHGLLHPRDVIMSADGPRVTGFGIAGSLSRVGMRLPVRRPYAAPDGPSDVYSLAAIAYELISGRRMTPTGWDELSAEDGPALREAFAAALSPDPHARPARAGDFAAKLRQAALNAGVTSRPVEAPFREDLSSHVETGAGPEVGLMTADPEFQTAPLDRYAEIGAPSDLQPDLRMDFAGQELVSNAPVAIGRPPGFLKDDEPEPPARRTWKIAALVLIPIAAVLVMFALRPSRSAPPTSPTEKTPNPVSSTTVELPAPPAESSARPEPKTIPPEPALPAPTPSRPASGAASSAANRSAARRGRLLIRSMPADAIVVVNGQTRGKTPLTVRDLPLGSYTIRIARDGFVAENRRVRLTSARVSASIEVPLRVDSAAARRAEPGSISVESRPAGARVLVNDRPVGSTPLVIPGVPAGPAAVRLEMDGYQSWATTVRVAAGEQVRVAASLDRK